MFLTLPLRVYISFDSPAGIGKPQTNCLGAFNGCPGLKGKTSLGDIQDSAAVVRVEIDIGGSVHCHPWTVASLRPHERYSPCVILGCFSVQSSRGTESGQTVTASESSIAWRMAGRTYFAGLGAERIQPLLSKEERPVNSTMVLLAAYAGPLAPTRGVPDGMGFVVAPRSRHRAVSVDP